MNRIISLMLAMAIGLLLVSCPMAPPLEPTDSFNPYLSPPAVDSLQATNGQKDTIMLTWDKSEGATSYHIYRIDSDEYGAVNERITGSDSLSALQKRGFALLDVVDGNSYQMKAEPGSSYIFSVVAAKDLGPSVPAKSRMLYSKTGAFAQGSTLGEIRVFGIADARYVNLYWGIDNFYSKLASNEGRKEPLYQDYAFRILYRKAGALTWKDAYAPSNAFSSSMIVSQYGMEPDTDYEFRIDFTVAPDGSSSYTSSSRVFTIKTDRTMTPYKAFDFAVTTDEFGKVELEWKSYPA
ncbi:MAG: fibronectin type III domain-containing protein, partial [Candidatus Ornithospirochaeta sp.]|nr:fibronectin type III domain-containing protein [Candidatus Ornithospirochaeta sp.]